MQANIACRKKGSHVRCQSPFCPTCGNQQILQRQSVVVPKMARHPAASVFAVTILDDAVQSVLSNGHDKSDAINRINLFRAVTDQVE